MSTEHSQGGSSGRGRPAAREVRLWSVRLDDLRANLPDWHAALSADERARAERFRFQADRERFTLCRAWLRHLLGACLDREAKDIALAYSRFGKPRLAPSTDSPALAFSLAHSHGAALAGITGARAIGVDLEERRPQPHLEDVASVFCCPHELQTLQRLPPDHRLEAFYNCWTRKEAYLKARGQGLRYPPQHVEVTLAPEAPPAIVHARDDRRAARRWTVFHQQPFPGYTGAVVVEGQDVHLLSRPWLP